jgi:hypothetical protein
MFDEQTSHDITKVGLELLCDVGVPRIEMYYSHIGTCLGLVQICSKLGHFYMRLCCWCQGV